MVNLRKIEDRSDTTLYQIHSGSLENCYLNVFAILSNDSRRPSWTAQLHNILAEFD